MACKFRHYFPYAKIFCRISEQIHRGGGCNSMEDIKLKRTYEPSSPSDGYRVLVDRLWPRGLSHAEFHYDEWDKEIAPSDELRRWFHADPESRWEEFERRYAAELRANPAFAALKARLASKPVVTLLYSSRDTLHNNAEIVDEELKRK